jgi:hypothetical protein
MDQVPPGGTATACGFEGDEIEELAERIKSLAPDQADEVLRYVNLMWGNPKVEKPKGVTE